MSKKLDFPIVVVAVLLMSAKAAVISTEEKEEKMAPAAPSSPREGLFNGCLPASAHAPGADAPFPLLTNC